MDFKYQIIWIKYFLNYGTFLNYGKKIKISKVNIFIKIIDKNIHALKNTKKC
jgi:hypothetical protein